MTNPLAQALERIAGYSMSQFQNPADMAAQCVQDAHDALADFHKQEGEAVAIAREAKEYALAIFGEGDVRSDLRELNERIDSLTALASPLPAVPAGHVVVPVEPTEAMLKADYELFTVSSGLNYAANRKNMWAAMIKAAAPQPQTQEAQ